MSLTFSVIIPAYNEAKTIGGVLTDISQQSLKPKEVIVADAHSKDATRKIATEFSCKVVDGGSPAIGRNAGAEHASGDILIFLDADLRLPSKIFFETVISTFEKQQLTIAACFSKSPSQESWKSKSVALLTNTRKILDLLTSRLFGSVIGGSGWFIAVERDAWQAIDGFNEKLYNHEDTDFVQRIQRNGGKFGLIPETVLLSGRRFDQKPTLVLFSIAFYVFMYKITYMLKLKKANNFFLEKYETAKGPLGGTL